MDYFCDVVNERIISENTQCSYYVAEGNCNCECMRSSRPSAYANCPCGCSSPVECQDNMNNGLCNCECIG